MVLDPYVLGGTALRTASVLPMWMAKCSGTAMLTAGTGSPSTSEPESSCGTLSGPPSPSLLRSDGWYWGQMLELYQLCFQRHEDDEMRDEWEEMVQWTLDKIRDELLDNDK